MKKILLTVIITLVVLVVAITAYIYSGNYDVSQMTYHNRIAKWMIRTTKHYSIKKRLKNIQVPPLNDTAMIVQGFMHYNEMCVIRLIATTGSLSPCKNKGLSQVISSFGLQQHA